jgi:hypothetical protein
LNNYTIQSKTHINVASHYHGLVQVMISEQLQNSIENTHKFDLSFSWLGTNNDI